MFKLLSVVLLISISQSSFAFDSLMESVPTSALVEYHLWHQGVEYNSNAKTATYGEKLENQLQLPEELELPLKQLELSGS